MDAMVQSLAILDTANLSQVKVAAEDAISMTNLPSTLQKCLAGRRQKCIELDGWQIQVKIILKVSVNHAEITNRG